MHCHDASASLPAGGLTAAARYFTDEHCYEATTASSVGFCDGAPDVGCC